MPMPMRPRNSTRLDASLSQMTLSWRLLLLLGAVCAVRVVRLASHDGTPPSTLWRVRASDVAYAKGSDDGHPLGVGLAPCTACARRRRKSTHIIWIPPKMS